MGMTCPSCGKPYDDDSYITEREPRNFWGAPCEEEIVVTMRCLYCGEVEE